ncbi:hypothetical protein HPB50_024267 [Hyalomma asiaticum]|uniref:Uncharacterized protein n=1 Tax=Hyalomma asiaticum TaxID=266040 RepID=A0ACB7S9K2_HYAAI|nr:hypothetical protein HPB50_024267 [Hyalomma asiaticum]
MVPQIVSFILIGVAAYGRVSSIVTNITIFGAVIACGVFLLLLSLVGLIGAVKHHQVLLFFVSFNAAVHKSHLWAARLYDECLRTQCGVVAGSRKAPAYREWCATKFRITEFLWNTVRPTLPKKKTTQGPSAKVLSLDDAVLPEAHLRTLGLGPKFCFEPTHGPPDILAVARSVTERVPEEERGRCVAEGAGVVNELKERHGGRSKVRSLVDFLTSSSIRCLVADKEGGFVVLHESTYTEKGMTAVAKNLKKVTENPRDVKKKAIALLEKLNLDKLCTGYMVILFLLFVVQFSVACACLAMTEDQERELASQGWKKASPAVRAQAERLFRCCGFERNASDPTAELQCEHVPTCCPPLEARCWSALHQAIRNGLKITGGIGMFFSFTELVAVFVAYRYRLQKDPDVDPYLLLGGGARVT